MIKLPFMKKLFIFTLLLITVAFVKSCQVPLEFGPTYQHRQHGDLITLFNFPTENLVENDISNDEISEQLEAIIPQYPNFNIVSFACGYFFECTNGQLIQLEKKSYHPNQHANIKLLLYPK
jgi:hypothetical protein